MTQLALGIDPEPIGVAPFIMATPSYPDMPAGELGLKLHPRARATIFPALGAYVGGDIVAGLLATGMTRDKRLRLFIDVGTNCEIALGSAERLVCTAAPAGPAFEAAQIRCGMRAADGAIEVVRIRDDAVELDVIGDVEPVGVCGSGLVDAVAELVRAGLLDLSGRFVPNEQAAEIAPALSAPPPRPRGRRAHLRAALAGRGRRRRERRLPLTARRARAAVRQGVDRHRLEPARRRSSASTSPRSSRCCSPARSAPTSRPPAPSASASSPGWRCRGSSRPATSPARAPRWRCSRSRNGHAATAMFDEVEYVELSDRDDFNDRFIDQLAFPETR